MCCDTKQKIAQALRQLMLERPLKKITVQDLMERTQMKRQTFYYHFKDIYDLVDWIFLEMASEFLEGKETYDTWQQGFTQILYGVLRNRRLIMNAYNSLSREQVERFLYALTYDLLLGVVEEEAVDVSIREEDKKFIIDFYKYAFVGFMIDWIKKGMKEQPEAFIEKLSILIKGDIKRALDRFRTDNSFPLLYT